MKRYFAIKYEIEGSKRIDEIMIWADSPINAVKEFTNTEITLYNDMKIKYTEHSIKSISC